MRFVSAIFHIPRMTVLLMEDHLADVMKRSPPSPAQAATPLTAPWLATDHLDMLPAHSPFHKGGFETNLVMAQAELMKRNERR